MKIVHIQDDHQHWVTFIEEDLFDDELAIEAVVRANDYKSTTHLSFTPINPEYLNPDEYDQDGCIGEVRYGSIDMENWEHRRWYIYVHEVDTLKGVVVTAPMMLYIDLGTED